jgi:hypothetical protein
MSLTLSPIRSPSHEPSGLRPDAVLVLRLCSVAFFFGLRRPAQSRCSATSRRCEEINLNAWLAGRTLSQRAMREIG